MKLRHLAAALLLGILLLPVAGLAAGTNAPQNATDLPELPAEAFGGMYYNEAGQLVVNIKEGADVDLDGVLSGDIVIASVQYSLAELEAMKEALEPYMVEYHIASLDANEVHHTIDIELTQEDGRIYDLIESLGLIDPSIVRITVLPEDYTLAVT